MKCTECNIELTAENTQPSFWKRGIRKCRKCNQEYSKQWKENNKERNGFLSLRAQRQRRLTAILAYGGECECCHEKTPEFLSIQHANGNGKKHRNSISGNPSADCMVRDLRERGYAKEFNLADGTPIRIKILCQNCHQSIDRYGYCPHKETKSDFDLPIQKELPHVK